MCSFLRRRFNWASEFPDNFHMELWELPLGSATRPKTADKEKGVKRDSADSRTSSDSSGSYARDELTHVRSIRVFEAVKLMQ